MMAPRESARTLTIEPVVARSLAQGRYPAMTHALNLRTEDRSLAELLFEQALLDRHARTLGLSVKHQLGVTFIGCAPAPAGNQVFRGIENDWALLNLRDDPDFVQRGARLVAPQRVLSDLQRIEQAGLDFEAIYIAHEIAPNQLMPGQPLALELVAPPPPAGITRRSQALADATSRLWDGLARAARAGARVGRDLSAGLAAGATGLGAAGLDPILFGLNLDRGRNWQGQPMAMWYYLTHWTWD